ncbi:MAG: uroporphyrinogen-III synthase [Bacteroidota bacterium]
MTPRPPLQGRRIVVTRSRDQADSLADALRALGATPILAPSIQSAPTADPAALAAAVEDLGGVRWLGFTSPSGVRHGWPAVAAAWPAGVPDGVGIAAVGPGTADALAEHGVRVDFIPDASSGDAFADELPLVAGDRVVLLRSDIARRAVAERLRARGASVTDAVAYRTVVGASPLTTRRALDAQPDAVTFTSPSTVRGFLDPLVSDADRSVLPSLAPSLGAAALVAIGPVTANELQRYGLAATVTADPSTLAGLTDALVRLFA